MLRDFTMGLSGGIEAGRAFVKFLLDDKELKSGLLSAGKQFQKFGRMGAAATAPIMAGLTACVVAAVSVGSAFADMSARTGVGVEALSELSFAAEQTGTSMSAVERGVKKMQKGIGAAASGTGTFGETLGQLGIDLRQLQAMSPEDQFTTLATAIGKIQDPTLRAAMAQKVFGSSGTALLPMITAVGGGVDGLREKARALGVTMTEEDAVACDALGDALDATKAQLLAMAVQIGVAIAGPLTEFLVWSQEILRQVIDWIKANPTLVRTIAAVTAGIAAASIAAIAFGTVLAIMSAHPIIAALTLISGLIIGIATYFGFASRGAAEFKKELKGIKVGGGNKVDPVSQRQADEVVRRLEGAANGPSAAIDGAAADTAERASADSMGEVVKWTKETAAGVARLVSLAQQGGFFAGSG